MYYHGNNSKFAFSTRKTLRAWDASNTGSKNVDYQKYYHLVGVFNIEEKYLQIFKLFITKNQRYLLDQLETIPGVRFQIF